MTDEGTTERVADERERKDGRDKRAEPLANLAERVELRQNRDPGHNRDELDDAFTQESVGDVDVDDIWADLEAEDSGELVVSAPREESEDDRDVRTIPKSTCHGCPQFGDPPSVHCTHEGTDILTMVDTEQFRVADCPMAVGEETPLTE